MTLSLEDFKKLDDMVSAKIPWEQTHYDKVVSESIELSRNVFKARSNGGKMTNGKTNSIMKAALIDELPVLETWDDAAKFYEKMHSFSHDMLSMTKWGFYNP